MGFSFSSSSSVSFSSSASCNGKTKSYSYASQTHSNPDGTMKRSVSQHNDEPAEYTEEYRPAKGAIESSRRRELDASRGIEDVTHSHDGDREKQ